jgi:hypothetical protein
MKSFLCAAAVWLAFLAPAGAELAQANAAENAAPSFTRFVEDETGARLQTGVGSYINKDGVRVDLIGAVHIADKAYYERLNARFTRYEVLLYEMVGESFETRKKWKAQGPKGMSKEDKDIQQKETVAGKDLQWLHPMYETMEKALGLTGQVDGIDYTKPNFVHADMTLRQFSAMQHKKNESFFSLWWKSVVVQMEHPEVMPDQPGLVKIMEILCRKDSTTEMKRLAGRMFGNIEGLLSGLESEDGTVILTERNRVALDVLKQQIALGKKNLALFYGAAHLQDMDKRLRAMGFTPVGHEWFNAWSLPPEPKEVSEGNGPQK